LRETIPPGPERRPAAAGPRTYVLTALVIIALSVLAFAFRQELHHLRQWGYLGLAIMSFLGGATVVLLPVPSLAFTFVMGAVLNPWTVGLVASSAETLGALSGFLAGASVRGALQGNPPDHPFQGRTILPRVQRWVDRYGLWAVFGFSAIPNPFLDLVGVAAGALRMCLWKFLVVCWLGKTAKTLVVAWAGAGVLPLVGDLLLH